MSAFWAKERPRSVAPPVSQAPILSVEIEAVTDQGEDAEPLAVEGPGGSFVLGVFDGLGGSGGARYDVDGVERKGAYLASRLARETTGVVVAGANSDLEAADQATGSLFAVRLSQHLRRDFKEAASHLGGEPTKLRSAMVRVLPTTAAIALVQPLCQGEDGQMTRRASAIWAGDSRIYVLTPKGLEQISRDDTRADADALTSLSTDPPIDNCISASEPFELRHVEWQLDFPSVVIAATDGCFGYFPTPAHFELALLGGLTSSPSLEECRRHLTEQIATVAGDDATLVAAILDGGDFRAFQTALIERRAYVEQEFVSPFEWQQKRVRAADEELDAMTAQRDERVEARDKCAAELWHQYRDHYERILAPTHPAKEGRR